jgi:hypothetical protein
MEDSLLDSVMEDRLSGSSYDWMDAMYEDWEDEDDLDDEEDDFDGDEV